MPADAINKTHVDPRRWAGKALLVATACLFTVVVCFGIERYSYMTPLAIIGIGVFALILCNPFIGLLVVVASLPFETAGMLGEAGSTAAVSVTKIGGLATFAAIALDQLLRRRPIAIPRLVNGVSVLVCLFAGWTVVSAALHPSEDSFRESVRLITIVVFFFVTVLLVNSEQRLRTVIFTWALMATAVSAYSLLQRSFGAAIGSEDWSSTQLAATVIDVGEENVGVMLRSAGTFSHPGWLALYLSLAAPLTLYMIWTATRALPRMLWFMALIVQAGAIFATYARTGYLALAVGVSLFLLRRRGGPAVLLWAALVTAATFPLWPDTVQARFESILDYSKSSSSVTRLGQQLVGWWMFTDNIASGVGPGNFEQNVTTYIDRVPDKWRIEVIGAHNMYVEVLAELGVQGLALLLLILITGFLAAEQSRRRAANAASALMYEALGVSLVVFAFSAALLHARYQKEWWLLLAIITAGRWISIRESSIRREMPNLGTHA